MQHLEDFLQYSELIVVPAEALHDGCLDASFATSLRQQHRKRLGPAWVSAFERAHAGYAARADALHAAAPEFFLPARRANIVIVTEPASVRPYYQPFAGSSWFAYAADFEPATSSDEFAVFVLIYLDALGRTQSPMRALARALPYLLTLSEAQIDDLRAGCARTVRSDAVAFRTLSEHLPALCTLRHESLAPLADGDDPANFAPLKEAGLLVPKALMHTVQGVANVFQRAAEVACQRYLAAFTDEATGEHAAGLVEYLRQAVPQVLVCAGDGAVLWDPDAPNDSDKLLNAAAGITRRAAESLRADLHCVSECSRAFLSALAHPERLKPPSEIDPDGGTYLHATRRLVIYNLAQPGIDTLIEPSPPFHRELLAARTFHEWGHVAVDAGWVRVPDARQDEFVAARSQLEQRFDTLLQAAPLREYASAFAEAAEISGGPVARIGPAFAHIILQRASDYACNLLVQRFLGAELRAYLRANVRGMHDEGLGTFTHLARQAYAFQYLRLAGFDEPFDYFMGVTAARASFVQPRIAGEAELRALFADVGALLACFEVDESAFFFRPGLLAP